MELYFLDGGFKIISVVDDYTCFIRRRRYYDCDQFELHCRPELFPVLRAAEYMCASDSVSSVFVVETVVFREGSLQIKGRSADCIFERMVIYPTFPISGTGEEVLHQLVENYTDIEPGELSGVGTVVERGQVTGYGLLDYMRMLSTEQQLSFSVELDDAGQLVFSVWQGTDRSSGSGVSPVIFSEDYENLISCEYSYSTKDYRNVAVVAGQGTGNRRKWVVVDSSNGGERRMLYVDARDIQQEDDMSDERYLELLRRRGREKLAQYSIVQSFEGEICPESSGAYRTDFDLGDIVTIQSSRLGLSLDCRITEAEEIFENGAVSVNLSFGEGFLTTISYIERMYG
ncbi:MAG: siphovirus ReqiPepy6 Gp37-like family protein [Clostridia bacterium]|nr:siphovirus ReqiPepy6 Gp37-like family protein [Clostridia bacterium]